ncbi:MAG: SIS domain-containing protein [Actinomycetota bacterium]|nr:SIS domain-containing protein [Actinomycetota bacterium]
MNGELMAAEMAQQPEVLAGLIERRAEVVGGLRGAVATAPVGIVLVARGSSDHAAIYGRYVLEAATGLPVALAAPSLHTLYDVKPRCEGFLAIGVSQSGRTPEIVTVLERLVAGGARAVAVTNETDSPLANVAGEVIALDAGEERAVPATKTFTAQLVAFAFLAEALGNVAWGPEDWSRLPGAVSQVLEDPSSAEAVAEAIGHAEGLVTVGRGYMYCVALEAALKLKETTSLLSEGYSAADLRHGPFAVVERDFPVLSFCAAGPAARDMLELTQWLRQSRGAHVLQVSEDPGADLPLPHIEAEPLMPVAAVVRAQQVAYRLALYRGMDPDAPVGLTKVTATE